MEKEGYEVTWTDTRKRCFPTARPWNSAPEAWSQTKGGWENWQAVPQEGLEETDDGTEADRRYIQSEHKCVEKNFTMASIKKVDTRKFKITVSNGYCSDSRKNSRVKTIRVPSSVGGGYGIQ